MMTMVFKHDENILFNPDIVTAFNKGETIQIKGGWGPNANKWRDWKSTDTYFGPWYYHKHYEWRVKPATIEIEVTREVKSKVEIPAPFKGTLKKEQDYWNLYELSNGEYHMVTCRNICEASGRYDVDNEMVYINKDTAQEALDILMKAML